jgi:molybdopterin-binding protein
MRPGLLLLDEPFSSLDYMTRMEMIEFIKKIRSEYNPSIFHISHDFEEALVMADRVSVIRAGAIVQQGRAHEVFHAPGDVFVAGFIGARNIFAGAAAGRGDAAVFKTEDGFEIYIGRDVSPSCRSAMVRADDIILARDAVETSATNTFRGRILDILPKRGVNEVCVDIGAQLYVYITNRSLRELGLGKGDSVYVLFKGSAVHVF